LTRPIPAILSPSGSLFYGRNDPILDTMSTAEEQRSLGQNLPVYLPLVENHLIRLADLLPGEVGHAVNVHLYIVDLGHHPQFEAISYVWGNDNDSGGVSINCNGAELRVTKNLHSALARLRYRDRVRTLWADALCINQGNTRERSHHVSFMGLIYEAADGVLACMGDDRDGRAGDVVSLILDHKARSSGDSSLEHGRGIYTVKEALADSRWEGVSKLLLQPWFSRAWVIQEVGLAKSVIAVYGQEEFDYRDFIRLMKWVVSCAGQLEAKYNLWWWFIHHDWYDWSQPPDTPSARDLFIFLFQASAMACKDPKDHIYAFLGHPLMQLEDGTPLVVPDYRETFHFKTLYSNIARPLLSRGDTRILASVGHNEDSISEDLTWTPRWDIYLVTSDFGVLPENWYRFSGDMEENQKDAIRVDGKKIVVRGVLFDMVRKAVRFPILPPLCDAEAAAELPTTDYLKSLKSSNIPKGLLILDRALAEVKTGPVNYQSGGQGLFDIFSLTLCAGRTTYFYNPAEENMKQHRDNFAAYWSLRQSVLRPGEPGDDVGGNPDEGEADLFVLDIQQNCGGRSLVLTERGYVGLGPWISEPGDVFCLIPGSRVPFVLRRSHDQALQGGNARYLLVGEAYLHGLMRGEVLGLIFQEGLEEEAIEIW
jgi:hypothetical protein